MSSDSSVSPQFENLLICQLDTLKLALLKAHEEALDAKEKELEQQINGKKSANWDVSDSARRQLAIPHHTYFQDRHADERNPSLLRTELTHQTIQPSVIVAEEYLGNMGVSNDDAELELNTETRRSASDLSSLTLTSNFNIPQGKRTIEYQKKKSPRRSKSSIEELLKEGESMRNATGELVARTSCTRRRAQLLLMQGSTRFAERLVTSTWFSACSATVVIIQSALLGIETELMATNVNSNIQLRVEVASHILTGITFAEFLLRIWVDGISRHKAWNAVDFIVLLVSVFDIFFAALGQLDIRVLRLLRLCKVGRIMRVGRLLQYIESFVKMTYCIMHSLPTFFPAFAIIFLLTFAMGIIVTEVTVEHLRDDAGVYDAHKKDDLPAGHTSTLRQAYGTLTFSIYSLGKSITAGVSWAEMFLPLMELHWSMPSLFIIFLTFNLLCTMNVVMSVFVENAFESTKHFKELMVEQKKAQKKLYMMYLQNIFERIDVDASGAICADEVRLFLDSDCGRAFFDVVGLGVADAYHLMRLLDSDEDGTVNIHEFCEGCMSFQGEATSFHMHLLMKESSDTWQKVQTISNLTSTISEAQFKLIAKIDHALAHLSDARPNCALQPRKCNCDQELPRQKLSSDCFKPQDFICLGSEVALMTPHIDLGAQCVNDQ